MATSPTHVQLLENLIQLLWRSTVVSLMPLSPTLPMMIRTVLTFQSHAIKAGTTVTPGHQGYFRREMVKAKKVAVRPSIVIMASIYGRSCEKIST